MLRDCFCAISVERLCLSDSSVEKVQRKYPMIAHMECTLSWTRMDLDNYAPHTLKTNLWVLPPGFYVM